MNLGRWRQIKGRSSTRSFRRSDGSDDLLARRQQPSLPMRRLGAAVAAALGALAVLGSGALGWAPPNERRLRRSAVLPSSSTPTGFGVASTSGQWDSEWQCPACGTPCTRPLKCIPCRQKSRVGRPPAATLANANASAKFRPLHGVDPADTARIKVARSATELRSILTDLKEAGRGPNVVHVSMAVARLGRMKGEWRAAVEMLRSAQERYGVEPNIYTYTSAISACEKGRQCDLALELLVEMKGRSIEPNVISYNAAISACGVGRRPERALELLAEMQESSTIQPDVISYNAAISACEKARRPEWALELLETMKKEMVEPDVITYNAAISACEKGRQWKRALELLDEVFETHHPAPPPHTSAPPPLRCSAVLRPRHA